MHIWQDRLFQVAFSLTIFLVCLTLKKVLVTCVKTSDISFPGSSLFLLRERSWEDPKNEITFFFPDSLIRYSALFPCSSVQSNHETPWISSGVSMLIAETGAIDGCQVSWSAAGAGKNSTTGQLGYQLNLLFDYACRTLLSIPLRPSVNTPSATSQSRHNLMFFTLKTPCIFKGVMSRYRKLFSFYVQHFVQMEENFEW